MIRIKHKIITLLTSLILSTQVFALEPFVVKDIRIEGLQGISKGTVLTYLPISIGEYMDGAKSSEILRSLYGTGFFENVSLAKQGNTLVIKVVEQPIIGSVSVSGNSAIKKEDMNKLLKDNGLVAGNVYSQANLDKLNNILRATYNSLGYYATGIDITTGRQSRNRVAVKVNISEGKTAKIKEIRIVGNTAFSSSRLIKQLNLSTTQLWSFITKNDQYSKQKLDASLESLRSYYMDRGYIHFQVDSSDVTLSDDKRKVFITIHVTEGPLYTFKGYKLTGTFVLPKEKLESVVTVVPGKVFSRKEVEDTVQEIGNALGEKGYALAQVEPIPDIDENNKEVFITFNVNPGSQVYVRRITYSGNAVTADYVMRRYTLLYEGSLLSTVKVKETIRQLNLLGFFKDVQVKMKPVPGTTNQVDIEFQLVETPPGRATFNVGYGTLGLELGAGVNQPNFLGTGKTVGINANRSRYATSASINYYDPFYTAKNVSRGVSLFYTKIRPDALNLANYTYDSYGVNVNYGVPVTIYDSMQFGYGYNHYGLELGSYPSNELSTFVHNAGTNFDMIVLNAGITHVGQDRSIFPTEGLNHGLSGISSAYTFNKPVNYYTLGYAADYLQPLTKSKSFILDLKGGVAYGNGYGKATALPFFLNFYAGGLAQGLIRGFETNTLGPRDSLGAPIGGNFLVHGTTALIFPNFISPDTLRTSLFVDAGNVYQTRSNVVTYGAGPIRYSIGLEVIWRSPLGPISVSLAKPLNLQPGDEKNVFQYQMGTSF